MHIHGLYNLQATQANQASQSNRANPQESKPSSSVQDQLDLSPEAQEVLNSDSSANSEGIRAEKIASIRQAIADGTYETPEKLSIALDRLLDTLA